jgi:preprotein translocase subunit SecA
VSQALTRYTVLADAVRAKQRRPEALKGLDRLMMRARVAAVNARQNLAYFRREADEVVRIEGEFRNHSDAALNERLLELRGTIRRGREDRPLLRRAFAAVREAARRETGENAYPVQVTAALALYHGRVVEMLTGEGKTLTGSLAAPLIAWRRGRLHVHTVNDYLARRDADSRRVIYRRCGLECGAIEQDTPPGERARLYALPIVYGTPKQIVADYLRDHLRLGSISTPWAAQRSVQILSPGGGGAGGGSGGGPLVPGLHAALVDEADAVLIDEAVVPLIIANQRGPHAMAEIYREAAQIAAALEPNTDFRVEPLRRRALLTSRGRERAAELAQRFGSPIWRAPRRAEELIRQAIVARVCYIHGRQYQIVDGRLLIVDEFTGRFLPDRHWEHGLHQSVEAKEGLEISSDRETLAKISFQKFFRSYPFLAGMTGTAADATGEIESVYRRKVVVVPTHRPIRREAWPTRVFRDARSRWEAVADAVEKVHALGRPVLIGTRSVSASEHCAALLAARGLVHRVLNANFDSDEATIISRAGESGSIVVATNMAGRGTDIKLDLKARNAGGLHVILTELHTAKRVDRQFIGRAGRQGDPGSSQALVCLEDELLRLYTPRLGGALATLARRQSSAELTGALRRAALSVFRLAQSLSQARDRGLRGQLLKQDDWTDKHLPGM